MFLILIRTLLIGFLVTSAHGQSSCQEIYKAPLNRLGGVAMLQSQSEKVGSSPRVLGLRSSTQKSDNLIYRDPELLRDLIKNRKFGSVSFVNKQGEKVSWFLSLSNNGRLYRFVVRKGTSETPLDMYADKPLPNIEKTYYEAVGRQLEMDGLHTRIKLPRKGSRDLVITPSVLVKLEVKHDLTAEQLIAALRRVPPNVKYRPNNASHAQGRDSFLFFLDVGERIPLEIVMNYENNTFVLLTAFFPDVYRN